MNKIIVAGHSYAFPYYFKVFEYVKNKSDFIFVLPKIWKSRGGRFKLQSKSGFTTYGLGAISYGGHGISGLLKGWLPGLVFLLPYLKIKYKSKVLYSCSEPNLLTTFFNSLIAKLCGMRYIFFTWQNVEPQKYMNGPKLKVYLALVRLNLRFADGVICGNKKAAKIIDELRSKKHELGILVSPVAGVDTEKFRPDIVSNWREKLGLRPEKKLILFYGALDKRKGLNFLINAFKILNTKYLILNTKLLIVGRGPEKKNIESIINNLKIQDGVKLLDWLPNDQLPALLNAADVFVYPSVPSGGWGEQFGYAMAEASACGIPVVATHTGSIDEVVQDGKSGLLIEPNNPEQLAGAISKILNDSNLAKQMAKSGREYIVKNFDHYVIAEKIGNFLSGFYTNN